MAKVKYTIRAVRKSDATMLVNNRIQNWEDRNDPQVGFSYPLKKPTRKQAMKDVRMFLKSVKKGNTIAVVAVVKGVVVGRSEISAVWPKSEVEHVATLGTGVIREYREIGIGGALTKECLERAREKFELIITEVFDNNVRSLKMLKRLGFKISGHIPKYRKRNGKYVGQYTEYLLMK